MPTRCPRWRSEICERPSALLKRLAGRRSGRAAGLRLRSSPKSEGTRPGLARSFGLPPRTGCTTPRPGEADLGPAEAGGLLPRASAYGPQPWAGVSRPVGPDGPEDHPRSADSNTAIRDVFSGVRVVTSVRRALLADVAIGAWQPAGLVRAQEAGRSAVPPRGHEPIPLVAVLSGRFQHRFPARREDLPPAVSAALNRFHVSLASRAFAEDGGFRFDPVDGTS